MVSLRDESGLRLQAAECARLAGATLRGAYVVVEGISIDSRSLSAGQLFVALRGPHFDGHDFVSAATDKGAAAYMLEHLVDDASPTLLVEDTRRALGSLTSGWRQRFAIPVVGVTGSNGKTTVKEMIASILERLGPTLSTRGNLNNEIGVPLTLARLSERHRYAVIEMGANHAGEIAYLGGLAQPSVALVTNAGTAHLEGFGTTEGVAHAKGEIFSSLADDGCAVINADDKYAALWRSLAKDRRQLTFGLEPGADFGAHFTLRPDGSRIELRAPQGRVQFDLALAGRHNVLNALAAAAAASAVGAGLDDIAAGLAALAPVRGRLQIKLGANGARIIDDTYNANPDSLRAALQALAAFPGEHILVLGDMGELGEDAARLHAEAGRLARETGVHRLYVIGDLARAALDYFGAQGRFCADKHSAVEQLCRDLNPATTVLVKGSRLAGMEEVVSLLVSEEGR